MIRRIFDIPASNEYGLPTGQILVTFDPATEVMHVAHRPNSWNTWTRSLPQIDAQDDAKQPGDRAYGPDGRAYSDGSGAIVRVTEQTTSD